MKLTKLLYLLSICSLVVFGISISLSDTEKTDHEKRVNIALRNAGHQLLLSNNDSTSLVLPVKKLNEQEFQVSFQNTLTIEPENLVNLIKTNLGTIAFSQDYIVEVQPCGSEEIVYSYQISENEKNTLIPCTGRELPDDCYLVRIYFVEEDLSQPLGTSLTLSATFVFLFLGIVSQLRKKGKSISNESSDSHSVKIGAFTFYSHQNKLIKDDETIELTSKECELLEIFSQHPNEIVKRETLIKKVWEDNGVVVGRSLDTYISKLRKKLKADPTIKLVNVHGVGYKLEIGHNSYTV